MSADGMNIPEMEQLTRWLKSQDPAAVQQMGGRIVRATGMRGLEITQDNTPRKSGRLQNSLNFGDRENYFRLKVGPTSWVVFGTTVDYAEHVEKGVDQTGQKGRFIPGFWQGDTFHYQPDFAGGMLLKGARIEGAHMFQKAIDALPEDMDRIALFEFRRLYAELFRG